MNYYDHMKDERLLDLHDGNLTPTETEQVKQHLKECNQCATRAADVQFWDGFMRQHMEEQGDDIGAL